MCNDYNIEKNVEKIRRGDATGFLTPNVALKICSKIKKGDYSIFKPFPDSEKVILYSKVEPIVKLFEIESYFPLTHQEIMGSFEAETRLTAAESLLVELLSMLK